VVTKQTIKRSDSERKKQILQCTIAEISDHGILGLRMSRISRNAGVTIPLISKYFGSRSGLIAVALGDWYEDYVNQTRAVIDSWIDSSAKLTLEEFLILAPKPKQTGNRKLREFRLQVLATAIENKDLGDRIKVVTSDAYEWVNDAVRRGREKLPDGDKHFDSRIFSILLFNLMYVFTDLIESVEIDDISYSRFLVDLIRASSMKNAPS
jgi:AcrR family transcriptional regulator